MVVKQLLEVYTRFSTPISDAVANKERLNTLVGIQCCSYVVLGTYRAANYIQDAQNRFLTFSLPFRRDRGSFFGIQPQADRYGMEAAVLGNGTGVRKNPHVCVWMVIIITLVSLLLLDPNYSSFSQSIRLGRRLSHPTLQSIREAMTHRIPEPRCSQFLPILDRELAFFPHVVGKQINACLNVTA